MVTTMRNTPAAEILISGPNEEPVTLAEAKLQVRQDHDDDNTYLSSLITAARQYCETFTRRSFINQTFDYYWHNFPSCGYYGVDSYLDSALEIYKSRITSVTHLKYYDSDGTLQTMSASDYNVDTVGEPGMIYPAYGTSWSSPREIPNAVQARVICGYGASASTVPEALKLAIKGLVGHWYANRESVQPNPGLMKAPHFVDDLLYHHRVQSIR